MWFKVGNLPISPKVLAGIIIGGGIILIILILLCFFLCCWKKDGKGKKRPQNISGENPPEVKGNHHGETIQERKQQNNLPRPRMAEHNRVLNLGPSPVAAARPQMQQPPSQSPAHLPQQASISSTESNSIVPQSPRHSSTPQWNSAYMNQSGGSEISDLSGNENSLPPPSPALSFGSQQIMFTFEDLAIATRGFSKANILGQGGFGVVHKGVLPNGKEIAVKSLRANRGQGEREFRAEVEIISRVHHRHLVSLVGYNISGSQRLLVYEFVPNKTLEFHLYGKRQPAMDWPTRLKVAVGAAKGLAYLHEYCRPRIIHRDIKAANILLDNNFKAQVADFGLAKLASDADTHVSTRIMGTLGYLAPEYASTGKITEKSDVYSFGVVLLELITGRKPVDKTQEQQNLVEWIKPLLTSAIEDKNFDHFVDPSLQYSYNHSEMARMVYCAATCVRNSSKRRPLMSQVVRALEGNISFGDLTKGITPGHSIIDRYKGSNKHSRSGSETGDSQYNSDSRAFDSTCTATSTREYAGSDHDGVTSEYGLYLSSTSSEDESTRELETRDVQRENRRHMKQHKS